MSQISLLSVTIIIFGFFFKLDVGGRISMGKYWIRHLSKDYYEILVSLSIIFSVFQNLDRSKLYLFDVFLQISTLVRFKEYC